MRMDLNVPLGPRWKNIDENWETGYEYTWSNLWLPRKGIMLTDEDVDTNELKLTDQDLLQSAQLMRNMAVNMERMTYGEIDYATRPDSHLFDNSFYLYDGGKNFYNEWSTEDWTDRYLVDEAIGNLLSKQTYTISFDYPGSDIECFVPRDVLYTYFPDAPKDVSFFSMLKEVVVQYDRIFISRSRLELSPDGKLTINEQPLTHWEFAPDLELTTTNKGVETTHFILHAVGHQLHSLCVMPLSEVDVIRKSAYKRKDGTHLLPIKSYFEYLRYADIEPHVPYLLYKRVVEMLIGWQSKRNDKFGIEKKEGTEEYYLFPKTMSKNIWNEVTLTEEQLKELHGILMFNRMGKGYEEYGGDGIVSL